MKKIITLLFMFLSISTAWSQGQQFEERRGFKGRKPLGQKMRHLRFSKHILSDRCITEANITPDQVRTLKKELRLLDRRMLEIREKIGELAKKQAEVAVKILTTPGEDPAEMLKITEEIGVRRTDQAKLSVKVLVTIRDTLQPEQCAIVVKTMQAEREKTRKRMKYMREKTL